MRSRSKLIGICAIMTAVGLIIGYLESFLVIPISVPGIRLGLANTVTLICLYLCGPVYAAIVLALRIILSSLLFSGPVAFIYSLCGALLSYIGMLVLKRFDFSVYGVSAGGAVLHNAGQIAAAYVLIGNVYVFDYLPVLAIAGVTAGLVTGMVSDIIIKRIRRITEI